MNFKNTDKYLGLEHILINYNNVLGQDQELDRYINEYKTLKFIAGIGLFTHRDKLI
jgi:hypothetical protein